MLSRLLHTPTLLLLRRIALLYVVLMLCRVAFYLYNASLLGPLSWGELGLLLAGALKFDTASVVYADGIFILLSLLPFRLAERGWYKKMLYGYYVIVNSLLIVAVNLADCVYFRYTQKRFTADEIFFADNSNSLQLVGKFLSENWHLGIVGVALIALLAWGYGRRVREESLLRGGWIYYAGGTLVFALGAALCIAGMRGGMTRMTRPITLSNATLYTPDSGRANLILSNPFCILRTIGSAGSIKYKKYFPAEELAQYFTPVHRPGERNPMDLTGINNPAGTALTRNMANAQTSVDSVSIAHPGSGAADSTAVSLAGRNVVIFILESMSAEHSAYLKPELYAGRETKGFTPFLDSLMRNGLTFRNMYANGTRSIQAMPSVLGSIPSFKTPFVLMPQSLGASRQLPAMLAAQGYSTAFFCGSEHGSMGFGAYARSAGVERLVSREDYEARHGTSDFDGYWGIWDDKFLQFAGEEFSTMPQPFFAALFTLSSHHPFVVPAEYDKALPEGYTKIHKGIAYEDMAFRRLFERFGDEEWFRHTVFVFVADHVSSEKFAPETVEYPGNMHIMGFIYTPDGALKGEVADITQQLDIMPTLLGILGNREPYFAFGRDVLNESERPRWSVSYDGKFRALTGDAILTFDDDTSEVIPHGGSTPADSERLLQRFEAMVQQYYSHAERKSYLSND